MKSNHNKQNSSLGWLSSLLITLLLAGSGAAWWAYRHLNPSDTPVIVPSPEIIESPVSSPEVVLEKKAQVYWFGGKGDSLDLIAVPVMLQTSVNQEEALKAAINSLLTAETKGYATMIPQGTELLRAKLTQEGIYLDLSEKFTEGGGSASMEGRLKQVLYTATSIDPRLPLWLQVNGQPLEVLGGEGIMVAQPMTRDWFTKEYE